MSKVKTEGTVQQEGTGCTKAWSPGQALASVNHRLALAMGTCYLPVQGLNHGPQRLLTSITP